MHLLLSAFCDFYLNGGMIQADNVLACTFLTNNLQTIYDTVVCFIEKISAILTDKNCQLKIEILRVGESFWRQADQTV